MKSIIEFQGKSKFKVKMREFSLLVDLPEAMGGDNTGPTPAELFVTSLGSCMGVFAVRYLNTAGLSAEGLTITLDSEMSEDHSRIKKIMAFVMAPKAVLGARKKALQIACEKCIVHNTLLNPPEITIEIG